MSTPLKVLVIEDSGDEALLVIQELRCGDFAPHWQRIDTVDDLHTALAASPWDVIIATNHSHHVDTRQALDIAKFSRLDIPFLVIGCSIGERAAVDLIKAGAHDYVMSQNLSQLPSIVQRELESARIRAKYRDTALEPLHSKERMQSLLTAIPDLMVIIGTDMVCRKMITNRPEITWGFQEHDPDGLDMKRIWPKSLLEQNQYYMQQALQTEKLHVYEQRIRVRDVICDGEVRVIKSGEDEVLFMIRDISNLKSNLKHTEWQLQHLIVATEAMTGQNLFSALAKHIAEALHVPCAIFTEKVGSVLRPLAIWANGTLQSLDPYDSDGTLCGEVLQSGKFHGTCSVKQLFPYASALGGQSIESYLGVALYGTQGDIIGVLCILHHQTIANPQQVEEALRIFAARAASELERRRTEISMRYHLNAIEAEIDGIGILKEDIFVYVNQAYVRLFGYDQPDDIVGKHWRLVHSLSTIERFDSHVFPALERDLSWQGEAIALRKNGTTFPERLSLTLTEDGLVICVCRDISELKQAQEQIVYNALHDPLTGLPNRTLLLERLEVAINRAHRLSYYRYAVLFLDLDRFKVINDSLGHDVGDQLLIAMAQQLTSHIHGIDLVARIGGDEFVILLEDVDNVEEVVHIADQILTRSQTPIHINEHHVFTSMSIGIVLGSNTYHHATDVIRDADIAMCRSKLKTNNSYKFFDAKMHIQALNRLSLETDLRQTLEQGNLVLQYQPIVQLHDQKLVGFEALVRWPHPTRGMIEPKEFVSIAEETGLIASLDHWVLHQACRQMAEWKAKFSRSVPLRISINLSAQNLRQPSLLENIDNILVDTGLDAHAIVLEITESMLIEDIEQTINLLDQLALRHIKVCIDDFGTGYSSLNYLHRLPVHHLKIDSGFVRQLQSDVRNYQVVSTIIALSKQLGLSVVAEGIETHQQLSMLQQLGCTFGQGYLFSSSLCVAEIENKYF